MPQPLHLALVGPGPGARGGIADHTVELATRLRRGGHRVLVEGWARPHPRLALPAPARRARDRSGIATGDGPDAGRDGWLRWDRPGSWVRAARRARAGSDRLVVVVTSPLQLPAVRTLTTTFRRGSGGRRDVVLIVHNVVPHERFPGDLRLMRLLLRSGDRVVVHSEGQATIARALGARDVRTARLPLHPPAGLGPSTHPAGELRLDALAFLGFVRPYKGLDVLLEALALTASRPRLIVRGEFWEPVGRFEDLAGRLGIGDRVTLQPGFADAEAIAATLAAVDAVVLPYRTATASQQPRLAFLRGVPVITTDVGDLAEQVRHDVDGLVVPTSQGPDPEALARAIDALYADGRWARLRAGVRTPDPDAEWSTYVAALVGG